MNPVTSMVARDMRWVRKGLVVSLALLLAVGFFNHNSAASQASRRSAARIPVQLFGTIEYRSDLRALPQWKRVLSVVERQMDENSTCRRDTCSSAAKSWQQVIGLSENKTPMEILKTVNVFFNKWPYRLDIEVYGVSDYWASPNEFLKRSGDCEDYSIIKYFALRQLGFRPENMRIVVLKDRIRNIGHAVLAVYIDGTAYILDNLSNLVLPHSRYQHYIPQYSVNGENRWAHLRPIGKQGF